MKSIAWQSENCFFMLGSPKMFFMPWRSENGFSCRYFATFYQQILAEKLVFRILEHRFREVPLFSR
eukprot:UN27808